MRELNKKLEEYLIEKEKEINRKKITDLPHPFEMKNLKEAVNIFIDSLEKGQKILIVGDYDADGILATTILIEAFNSIGLGKDIIDYYIPHRIKDGYGLSPEIIDYAQENGFQTILTVDNGISAIEAIEKAKKRGMTVIVTDHHTPPPILPKADIIVNPKQKGETFPFIEISGATVAWYFLAGLKSVLELDIDMKKFIDLVAITIISDVMPVKNINIPLLEEGLKQIKKQKRYLYKLIWNDWTAPTINETSIAFQLVPLINAIGRINNAKKGVELFLSKNKTTIENKYHEIKKINEARKELSEKGLEEALKQIKEIEKKYNKNIKEIGVIFIKSENFHEGIVGIIAGKIAEKYGIPTYVFGYNKEKNIWKGSGRNGNSGVHLYNFTNTFHDVLENFGGHKGAVGLSVKDENFEKMFKIAIKNIKNFPKEKNKNENIFEVKNLKEINSETLKIIKKYAPYGEQKPLPEFITEGYISPPFKVLKEKHLKFFLEGDNNKIEALLFNLTDDDKEKINQIVKKRKKIKVKFILSENYNLNSNEFSFNLIANLL